MDKKLRCLTVLYDPGGLTVALSLSPLAHFNE